MNTMSLCVMFALFLILIWSLALIIVSILTVISAIQVIKWIKEYNSPEESHV